MKPIDRLREILGGRRAAVAVRDPSVAASLPFPLDNFRALAEASAAAVVVLQDDGIVYANGAAAAVTGRPRETLLGQALLDLVHPDYRDAVEERWAARRRGEPVPPRFEAKLLTPQGRAVWADVSEADVQIAGRPAVALMAYDVTDRRLAEEAVRESERRLRDLIENVQLVSVLVDAAGDVTFANPYLLELSGHDEEQVVGRNWFDLFLPDDRAVAAREAFVERLRRGVVVPHDEYEIVTARGERRWIAWNNTLLHGPGDQVVGAASIGTDVTDRRRNEERLIHDALHDSLTGLPNRALFMDRLAIAVARLKRRPDYVFAVLFLDVDRFKVVNDSLGHLAGDQLLVQIGRLVAATLRREHTLARLGGDEFAILLDDIRDQRDALRVVERIHAALEKPISLVGQDLFATVSIGIAFSAATYERAEDVLRDADTAMYQAKVGGRAGHQVFDVSMHESVIRRLRVEHSLRRAVENEELVLHFQPIVSLPDRRIAGFEALVRWQHPERGLVPPGEFIHVAEETGLIFALGRWTLRQACRTLRGWGDAVPPGVTMSVNLSAREFSQEGLGRQIEDALVEFALPPSRLRLEITESVIMENPEGAVAMLRQLKELGPSIAIDDFGTGYSSLAYLLRFPADVLKVDRSFVSALGAGGRHDRVVEAIVSLAHSLEMSVVAEGIETAEQGQALLAMGCGFGQGYLFAKPLEAAAAGELLATGKL